MQKSIEDAKLLRYAADYIKDRGWITGATGGYGGPACMAGAMRMAWEALRPHSVIRFDSDALIEFNNLRKWVILVCDTRTVAEFNDHVCQGSRDAIAALEVAADLAEAGWEGWDDE